jgi:hypothetical protein
MILLFWWWWSMIDAWWFGRIDDIDAHDDCWWWSLTRGDVVLLNAHVHWQLMARAGDIIRYVIIDVRARVCVIVAVLLCRYCVVLILLLWYWCIILFVINLPFYARLRTRAWCRRVLCLYSAPLPRTRPRDDRSGIDDGVGHYLLPRIRDLWWPMWRMVVVTVPRRYRGSGVMSSVAGGGRGGKLCGEASGGYRWRGVDTTCWLSLFRH